MDIIYVNSISVRDYNNLRSSVGWGMLLPKQALSGIENSDYLIAAIDDNKTVGMARVLTDKGCVALILDVVVLPGYQGNGIGRVLLESVMSYIDSNLASGEMAYVALMAATGKEDFYKKFGFEERPNDHHGAGMTQWIRK